MRSLPSGLALGLAALLGTTLTTTTSPASPADAAPAGGATAARATAPALAVRRLATGLDHPWDVRPIGGHRLIFTQRDRASVSIFDHGRTRRIQGFPSGSVWVSGETGLMGLEVDPAFASNHRFWTCQGGRTARGHDVRVVQWRLDGALTRVVGHHELLGGFPASTGRHGGCRILAVGHRLYVGTGDAAIGRNPESKRSLGGKTLCLLSGSGKPCRSNPFVHSRHVRQRYVQTWGHRNVQGIDRRADGTIWSVEQGTYRDDEVNRIRNGADYGYNPVPGYNESVPMTDQSLPGRQRAAVWRSGNPTIAASGGGWVYGKRLGWYDGTFAVAALKGERVVFLKIGRAGRLQATRLPQALRRFGRIRTVVDGPGSVFYVTTDNGGGHDAILKVHPRRR